MTVRAINLGDTVRALEAKNITVAINLGIHQDCALDSNCPIAIQLRRLIAGTGITFDQLLEGYQAVTAQDPVSYRALPEIDAHASLIIAGKTIDVDLRDVVGAELGRAVASKMRDLERMKLDIKDLGKSLYSSYLSEIIRIRSSRTLPQLDYSVEDILKANCFITSNRGCYIFLFPVDYNPQYIVTQGIRHQVSPEDVQQIRREAYLQITVTPENKILGALLLNREGNKLSHYHGSSNQDCWGAASIPPRWDKSLLSLYGLVQSLTRSLITINKDSLMNSSPENMPHIQELFNRSVRLGREGELEERIVEEPSAGTTGWGRTWGRTGRTRRQTNPTRGEEGQTREEQVRRRFGRTVPELTDRCILCGLNFGVHFGGVCPRDRR